MRDLALLLVALFLLVAGAFLLWRLLSRRFSLPCPSWLGRMVELDNPFARSNHAAFIVSHRGLRPGMTVLDAGCGPGRLALPLAAAVAPDGRVLAVDLQDGMLAAVAAKAKAAGVENLSTARAAIGAGRVGREEFDRAVMSAVLGDVPDRGAAM